MKVKEVIHTAHQAENEKKLLEGKYEELQMEMEILYEEIGREMFAVEECIELRKENVALREEVQEVKKAREELHDYIHRIEEEKSKKCKGRTITEVGPRQRQRKLEQVRSRGKAALWFMETFGITVQSLNGKTSDGKLISVDLQKDRETQTPEGPRFNRLFDEEKEAIEQVLFLLDKFYVSDEVYHKLTQISEGLPKSYLIKQCREELNKACHLRKTPGEHPGVEQSFRLLLQQ